MHLACDMHCHLGFAESPAALAGELAAGGLAAFSCGVEPSSFASECSALGVAGNVRVGLGMHPWWVSSGEIALGDVELFCELSDGCRWIGEVGLDFGKRHVGSKQAQVEAFERVADAISGGGRIVSIHAVRSASAVMDILERHGALAANACVFHWFSGSSSELVRARDLGFYFSVNQMMLASRRGAEYLKAFPADRLLLETDWPPSEGEPVDAAEYRAAYDAAFDVVARVRGEAVADHAAQVGAKLLGLA